MYDLIKNVLDAYYGLLGISITTDIGIVLLYKLPFVALSSFTLYKVYSYMFKIFNRKRVK